MSVNPATSSAPLTSATSSTRADWLLFVLLGFFWGSSYLFIKIGVDAGLAPFTLVTLRLFFGALLPGCGRLRRQRALPRDRQDLRAFQSSSASSACAPLRADHGRRAVGRLGAGGDPYRTCAALRDPDRGGGAPRAHHAAQGRRRARGAGRRGDPGRLRSGDDRPDGPDAAADPSRRRALLCAWAASMRAASCTACDR